MCIVNSSKYSQISMEPAASRTREPYLGQTRLTGYWAIQGDIDCHNHCTTPPRALAGKRSIGLRLLYILALVSFTYLASL